MKRYVSEESQYQTEVINLCMPVKVTQYLLPWKHFWDNDNLINLNNINTENGSSNSFLGRVPIKSIADAHQ